MDQFFSNEQTEAEQDAAFAEQDREIEIDEARLAEINAENPTF